MKNIEMISIDKLMPHPDNPRKNLGDVTELADSIRAVGVMQNLTVVPHEDGYRILIGHRRAAAAKEAGLKELPCAVVNIPEKEQVEIMLVENMQRSDLTVLEESMGLQMMIDMGNSIHDICEKTGFSESKVRHRVKMGELDQKLLQKKFDECQNISILDLQKLEKIKDPKRKDRVLRTIGTSNFEMALKKAIDEEKREAWEESIFDILPEGISPINSTEGKSWLCSFRDWTGNDIALKKIEDTEGKLYWKRGYSTIEIYIDTPESEIKERETRAEERRVLDDRKRALKAVLKRMREMRQDFIKELPNRDCGYLLMHDEKMQKYVISTLQEGCAGKDKIKDFLDIKLEDEPPSWDAPAWVKVWAEHVNEKNFKKAMLVIVYLNQDNAYAETFDYEGRFNPRNTVKDTYEFMKILGYQMSDEEVKILNGSHELYAKEEE